VTADPLPESEPHLSLVPDSSDLPADHAALGTQGPAVGGDQATPEGQQAREAHEIPALRGPVLLDPFLGLLAETVSDLEDARKGLANRYRQLTRVGPDKDGKHRGLGLSPDDPEVGIVGELVTAIGGARGDGSGGIEHAAVLKLQKRMRKHPLWDAWGAQQRGVGEKTLARLLAAIGDPYWNERDDRPRIVSELWAYCGLHVVHPTGQHDRDPHVSHAGGVAPKRRRGAVANWSSTARMRVYLVAEACLKAGGPYAGVYRAAREKYEDAVHTVDCAQCGSKGKSKAAGTPLNPAHQHARAMRILMKEILRDLWVASRDLHEAGA